MSDRHLTMKSVLLLAAVMSVTFAAKRFDGEQVLRIIPAHKGHLKELLHLHLNDTRLDFWTHPGRLSRPVDVRVPTKLIKEVKNMLDKSDMQYYVMIDNFQQLIDNETASLEAPTSSSPVGRYARLGDIHGWLDEMAAKFPSLAQTFVVGKTYEGRSIKGIKIGETSAQDKPVIWIHAGIHAREWIAPASSVYIINHLLTTYATDAGVRAMVDGVAWFITPSANPDGYEYSHLYDRMWRKTRTPNPGYSCRGTDPNRNWDDHFGLTGTSGNPCSDIYRGPHPFSEPNTKALSSFILGIKDRTKIFVSLHCYSQMTLTSWGWTDHVNPPDHQEIQRVAKGATDALNARHGKNYEYGPGGAILYPAAGAEDDWAKGKAGIKYSYTFELRPGPYSSNGFILPSKQIIPTGEEVWSGISWAVKDVYGV